MFVQSLSDPVSALSATPFPPRRAAPEPFEREMIAAMPRLRLYAYGLCREKGRADDLTQEALLRAWAAKDRYQIGSNFSAWILKIARNLFYSGTRRSWREVAYDRSDEDPTIEPSQLTLLMLDDARNALRALTPEQRRAIYLVGIGGYSYGEAAALCGTAEGTIKSRFSRGKAKLQGVMRTGAFDRDGATAQRAVDLILGDLAKARAREGGAQ